MSIRRLSQKKAEEKARRIAREFLAGSGFRCLGARPDSLATVPSVGKVSPIWIVVFDRHLAGAAIDGPIAVKVDLINETAAFANAE